MRFTSTPRTAVVQWVGENCAQHILATLSKAWDAVVIFDHTKFGKHDYYNVYNVYSRTGNKLIGYALECYSGGAYIVRPRLPSEPRAATQRGTVHIKPKIAYQDAFYGV